ncbi:hypothetical protein RYX36_017045, partial [Vicia faba]
DMKVEEDEGNMLVDAVGRSIEDGYNENAYDYQDEWGSYWDDGMDIETEEEDNELIRSVEDYHRENPYGDNRFIIGVESDEDEWNYGWGEGIEIEEEDIRFVPAAKSCIEGFKTVTLEEVEKCTICLEDFNVGVCLPCSHMFHMNCIQDWLNIGNFCPLCRFQLPTNNTSE